MIPKIIHQTARTAEIPERWRTYQQKVISLHPGWEYRIWTDADNRALVETSAPHLLSLYSGMPRNIMRADMIRYVIMDLVGGLYLDFDYEFLKPFDLLDKQVVLTRESDDSAELFLGNSVIASERGHPFWKRVLAELERSLAELGRAPVEDEVNGMTGPGLITRTYLKEPLLHPGIHIPSRVQFNPIIPTNRSEYSTLVAAGEAYGIHYCHGTWTAKTCPQRLMRKATYLWSRFLDSRKGVNE
jgi:hypothetical protein